MECPSRFETQARRVYLDHAGAALPSPELMSAVANFLTSGAYLANPHSRHPSSQSTHALVETARTKLLDHFNVDTDENGERDYAVIFTSGATASLKLLAETFHFGPISGSSRPAFTNDVSSLNESNVSTLMMLRDCHTSVMGMRNIAKCERVLVVGSYEELELHLERRKASQSSAPTGALVDAKRSLFVLTAMSNFCGRKYPLQVVRWMREKLDHCWSICLDAAALLGCSGVDLSRRAGIQPDFLVMSAYKVFGFPTGLGALLVKRSCGSLLRKEYFGGGAVDFASDTSVCVRYREDLEQRFEDGTPDFYSIAALRIALQLHSKADSAMRDCSFALAHQAYKFLSGLKHTNGRSVARVYGNGWKKSPYEVVPETQGPIVTFNLLRDDETWVGYSEVEKMCDLFSIELRTGCFCNQGACSMHLELSEETLQKNLESGKICGDEVSFDYRGHPIGAVRISFGRGSMETDLETFKKMITCCFVAGRCTSSRSALSTSLPTPNISSATLSRIFVYPIKSCAAMKPNSWPLAASGFAYDRHWMFTSHGGIPLTQKRFPALCSVLPEVDLARDRLILRARSGFANDESTLQPMELSIAQIREEGKKLGGQSAAQRCNLVGGRTMAVVGVGGDQFSEWVSTLHPSLHQSVRLVMASTATINEVNFANVAQFLLTTTTSIKCLAEVVGRDWEEVMWRFRPNLVLEAEDLVPFDEDNFVEVWIGGIRFEVVQKCTRCEMICIDQDTGEKDPNLLIALRDLRRGAASADGSKASLTFGVYLKREKSKIHLTDTVELEVGSSVRIIRGRVTQQ